MNFLLILPNNPGDVLMGLQTVSRIVREGHTVDYIVDEECASLAENHPQIRNTLVFPRNGIRGKDLEGHKQESREILQEFLRKLRENLYDVSCNLFQDEIGAFLQHYVRATQKNGAILNHRGEKSVHNDWAVYLYAIPANRQANSLHVCDIYARIAGMTKQELPETLLPPSNDREIESMIPQRAYVVLHPGSAWPGKQWPEEHWTTLIKLLLQQTEWDIVLTGSPEEQSLCKRVHSDKSAPLETTDRVHNLCGKTTLLNMSQVYSKATMVICGDTFAMHMAAACQTQLLALFGASNPVETGPCAEGSMLLLTEKTPGQNLDFARESNGLRNLSPLVVLEVMQGKKIPLQLWETRWSDVRGCWYISPVAGGKSSLNSAINSHVTQSVDAMRSEEIRALHTPLVRDTGTPAEELISLLQCQIETLETLVANSCFTEPSVIRELENREHRIADLTTTSITFEMHRIRLNSLNLADAKPYFQQRLQLTQNILSLCLYKI